MSLHMDGVDLSGSAQISCSLKSIVLKCKGSPDTHLDTSLECAGPLGSVVQARTKVIRDLAKSKISDTALFDKLKKEHDLAKAVKNDNAACPVHLWDDAVWAMTPLQKGHSIEEATEPSESFKLGLHALRHLFLRVYC